MEYGKASKQLSVVALSVLLTFISGCFWSSDKADQDSKLYLVNVLDKAFFDDCHIPGSLNIPMQDVKKHAEKWSKKADVVIYCSNYSCEASTHCCKQLSAMGFESVWDYDEGMAGWYQEHKKDPELYPIVGPAKQPYLTMDNKPLSDEVEHDSQVKVITTDKLKALIDAHRNEGR